MFFQNPINLFGKDILWKKNTRVYRFTRSEKFVLPLLCVHSNNFRSRKSFRLYSRFFLYNLVHTYIKSYNYCTKKLIVIFIPLLRLRKYIYFVHINSKNYSDFYSLSMSSRKKKWKKYAKSLIVHNFSPAQFQTKRATQKCVYLLPVLQMNQHKWNYSRF